MSENNEAEVREELLADMRRRWEASPKSLSATERLALMHANAQCLRTLRGITTEVAS